MQLAVAVQCMKYIFLFSPGDMIKYVYVRALND